MMQVKLRWVGLEVNKSKREWENEMKEEEKSEWEKKKSLRNFH